MPPDGKVCEELLAAQVRTDPAGTKAPEAFLDKAINSFVSAFEEEFSVNPIKDHADAPKILRSCHRFRAVDEDGLYALAKDLNRLFVERLDHSALKQFAEKKENLGSIKLVERALSTVVSADEARSLTSIIVGTFDLRKADAHLAGSELEQAISLAGIEQSPPWVQQGGHMLHNFVGCLFRIAQAIGDSSRAES
ncbi:hypothetical protein [Henriciella marina]|uniref:DUF2017 domain-containing protein n=1 Tax=Henriciella marina TaxID=453851 RepID=A0ABT4LQL4_9PROT|nr:hypothetical protein [Henriciella marina]MCZ4296661.1 hypothetical protein [Henriciella marina]